MRSKSRALIVAVAAVVPLLLVTACGGDGTDAGTGDDLTPIQGSSYVTIEPATTTTTTSLAPGEASGAEPGSVSPQEQTYTVQSGDSVFKIASLFGLTADVLAAYNSWPEGIQHSIFPGDVVRIPPNSKVPDLGGATAAAPTDGATDGSTDGDATAGTTPDATGTDGECPTTYVIQSGDTSRIGVAEKFGITFEQMDAANVNTPGYSNFVVGTPITIPCP
jgi:LysM repeat protein